MTLHLDGSRSRVSGVPRLSRERDFGLQRGYRFPGRRLTGHTIRNWPSHVSRGASSCSGEELMLIKEAKTLSQGAPTSSWESVSPVSRSAVSADTPPLPDGMFSSLHKWAPSYMQGRQRFASSSEDRHWTRRRNQRQFQCTVHCRRGATEE